MKRFLYYAILASVCGLSLAACSKQEHVDTLWTDIETISHCGCDDAMRQLEWLRNTVNYMESHRGDFKGEISICKYDDGKDGFLTNYCVSCADGFVNLHDCQGNVLVSMGGIAGVGYDVHDIDRNSIRCIYRNYHIPHITDNRWQLTRFVDRATQSCEQPIWNNQMLLFWLEFKEDGTVVGKGINQLEGNYTTQGGNIHIYIGNCTEIYDASGWEERMLNALNEAIEYTVSDKVLKIYYHYTNTYMEFRKIE